MHHECSHYTHMIKDRRERDIQTDLPAPKMYFKWQPSLYRSTFSSNGSGFFFSDIDIKYAAYWDVHLKQPSGCSYSENTKSRMKKNVCKSNKKSCSFSWLYRKVYLILSQSLASHRHFVRLALPTWQINSVMKPNIRFMDTNGKETVSDMYGNTKGTDCSLNRM